MSTSTLARSSLFCECITEGTASDRLSKHINRHAECVLGSIPVPGVKTTYAGSVLCQPSAIKSDLNLLAQEPLLLLGFLNCERVTKKGEDRHWFAFIFIYLFVCWIFSSKWIKIEIRYSPSSCGLKDMLKGPTVALWSLRALSINNRELNCCPYIERMKVIEIFLSFLQCDSYSVQCWSSGHSSRRNHHHCDHFGSHWPTYQWSVTNAGCGLDCVRYPLLNKFHYSLLHMI